MPVGMSKDQVKQLQAKLNGTLRPSPNLKVDGLFGPRTRTALETLERMQSRALGNSPGKLITAGAPPASQQTYDHGAEAPAWMAIAESELGQHEIAGSRHNPRILAYHATTSLAATTDEVAWCSSFVNWVMRQAGHVGTNSAAAASWINWGKSTDPRYGAITVIKKNGAGHDARTGSTSGFHVGFFLRSDGTHFELLGGNQSDSVKVSRFSHGGYTIRAYRWP